MDHNKVTESTIFANVCMGLQGNQEDLKASCNITKIHRSLQKNSIPLDFLYIYEMFFFCTVTFIIHYNLSIMIPG